MTQKAVIVRTGPDGHDGLEALNIELERGWRVAEVTPMGGAETAATAPTHAAVAALEELGAESEIAKEVVDTPEDGIEDNGTDPPVSSSRRD